MEMVNMRMRMTRKIMVKKQIWPKKQMKRKKKEMKKKLFMVRDDKKQKRKRNLRQTKRATSEGDVNLMV